MLKVKKEYLENKISFPKKSEWPGQYKFSELTQEQLHYFVAENLKNPANENKIIKYFDNKIAELREFAKGGKVAKVEKPAVTEDVDVIVEANEETGTKKGKK